jgi:hypothetical protein
MLSLLVVAPPGPLLVEDNLDFAAAYTTLLP